jgi:hypothetical protein
MRKNSKWVVLAVLLVAIGAPNAQADSYTPTFTCTGTCVSLPTAPGVTFPSPTTIQVTWNGFLFDIPIVNPLPPPLSPPLPLPLPTDSYEWSATVETCSQCAITGFVAVIGIVDLDIATSPTSHQEYGDFIENVSGPSVLDSGTLSFASVATPEPNSVALVLPGVGLLWVMRKRIALALGVIPEQTR